MTDKQKNFIKAKAIEERNKARILAVNCAVRDVSGIYYFTRYADGFKYAYIGQAKQLLTRLSQHLSGYQQHIDRSIKKHGLVSKDNPTGWHIGFQECAESELNAKERELIKLFADGGFQLRNVTAGGQDSGKTDINERKPTKTYRDGVAYGEKRIINKIAHWFDLHLKAVTKQNEPSKTALKVLEQFTALLQGESEDD